MRFVLSLSDVACADERSVGGKAKALAWLAALGVPVPPAVCVTTDVYRKVIEEGGLSELERAVVVDRDASAAAELRRRVIRVEPPAQLKHELERGLEQLASARGGVDLCLAVRSSAVGEDAAHASFAGQFESVLNVRGPEQVLDAIRQCWASLWSEHAVAYRRHSGVSPEREWAMGVVVQELVPADVAGVAFSVHPVTGRDDVVVVDSGLGLAAKLVSGEQTADSYVVEKVGARIVERTLAEKSSRSIALPSGGIGEEATSPAEARAASLDDESLARLVELVVRVETSAGAPVDVEWVLRDGAFSLVQSRPVTRRFTDARSVPAVSWTLASELFPEPIAPWDALLFQVFLDAYNSRRMEWGDAGLEMRVREVDGYLYTTEVASGSPTCALADAAAARRALQESVPIEWRGHVRGRLQTEFRAWLDLDLRPFDASDLLAFAERVVEQRRSQESQGLLAGMVPGLAMDDLRELLEPVFGDETDSVVGRLLQGLPSLAQHLESALCELVEEIRANPAWKLLLAEGTPEEACRKVLDAPDLGPRVRTFLHAWGFHGLDGIMSAPWGEQPEQLIRVLRARMDRVGEDLAHRLRRLESERANEAQAVEMRLPAEARADFRERLRRAEVCVPLNQDRYIVVVEMGYAALRRILLSLGARLEAAGRIARVDDVFFASLDELGRAVAEPAAGDLAQLAPRREAWAAAFRRQPPPILVEAGGILREPYGARSSAEQEVCALSGLAAAPGLARGSARVLQAVSQIGDVCPGDVLVTRMTTPAWTPVFPLLRGVVTETGSLLSHPAVLAREYGIPAVVSARNATRTLSSGTAVVVDGDRGRVFEADSEEPAA